MTGHSDIPSDYIDAMDVGTSAPQQRSQLRDFLRKPVEDDDIKDYGTSKPKRKIIRAKLVHAKD